MLDRALRSTSLLILTTALLLAGGCSSDARKVKSRQAELYYSSGTQSLMDKEYTTALKSLVKANELDANNPEILNNLGMAYYFKGHKELAVRNLNRALELNETNSDARVNLASIYLREGKLKQSESLYKKVLEDLTYDKQARTLYNLGIIEAQYKKNTVSAENYFKKSIKEDDNYCPSYYQLGLLQYHRRQYNSALKNFKEASMGTCYESPAPQYYQGLTMVELRRFDEARIKFDEIESRFKKSDFAVKARAKSLELGDIESRTKTQSHAARKVLESPEF
ncbi:MAG TPA: tetratricopeptide repeat protein [Bacteriovoracaceae bacterium]|nr:tetratricopeptide repeat protein [Bacteriovoracaceae bacterium]